MGRRAKGFRHKSRTILKRKPRERGKTGLSKILQDYSEGEKVVVKINPSVHGGMPHRRYFGRVGVIVERRGRSYVVNVPVGDAVKELVIRPEHLRPHTAG